MFHVELRQFPHVARAFNLTEEELDARILTPWLAGRAVQHNDRQWAPDRARLTIYEGPELRTDQLGLGRGWAEVTKSGRKVTDELLARGQQVVRSAESDARAELLRRAAERPVTLEEVIAVSGSEEIAERVVLDLLRQQKLKIVGTD